MIRCSNGLRSESLQTAVVLLSVWHHDPLLPDTFLGEVVLLVDNFRNFHRSTNRRCQSRAEWLPLRRPSEPIDGPFAVCSQLLMDCVSSCGIPLIPGVYQVVGFGRGDSDSRHSDERSSGVQVRS